jgi:chitin-binding protein
VDAPAIGGTGGETTTDAAQGGAGGPAGGAEADAAAADAAGPGGADAQGLGGAPAIAGCTLMWAPSPMRDGEKAFELPEMPDLQLPGGSAPTHGGVKHLTAVPEHDAYRVDSHYAPPGAVDYDRVTQTGPTRTDRLRCELRGMVGPSGQIDMVDGQTWRISWSLFIPGSLKGTGRFTHIFQLKFVDKAGGQSGSPIITLTLRPPDDIQLLFWLGGGTIATTSVAGLHDRWLTSDLTVKLAANGSAHWTLSDGAKVVVDKEQAGVTWPSDAARARPKWGIYRGITGGVQTTYLLLSDMRAYRCP